MIPLKTSTISCFNKKNPCFVLQNGYWEMNDNLEKLLGIDFSICKDVLETAGLKSLGWYHFIGIFLTPFMCDGIAR
jgi:hypothetical protein